MAHSDTCNLINSLMVDIHRSLVQYAAEASPWSSEGDNELKGRVLGLASTQNELVASMVEFLRERKHLVDFGVYPQEYTSLHFVSLEYFLNRMQESQENLVSELEEAASSVSGDSEAVKLIESAIASNKEILSSINDAKLANAS